MNVWFRLIAIAVLMTGGASQALAQAGPQGGGGGNANTAQQLPRQQSDTFQREMDSRQLDNDPTGMGRPAFAMAECVARRAGNKAGGLLGGALLNDPGYQRISEVLQSKFSNCRRNVGQATPMAVSGALAEHLVITEAPTLDDRVASPDETAGKLFYGDMGGAIALDNVAGCLAFHSPGLVYRVLKTGNGSAEEFAALTALYTQTPECGVIAPPPGVPSVYHRGALATGLYAWMHPKT